MRYVIKRVFIYQVIFLAVGFLIGYFLNNGFFVSGDPVGDFELSETGEYLVTRVYDGDTILLSSGEKIRYIGIDTPEINYNDQTKSDCMAEEAKQRNIDLVLGKKVRLETDKNNKDKYDRLLRYVYVGDVFVNQELIVEGLAKTMWIGQDTKYKFEIDKLEDDAQEKGLGIWGECL
jgi:micrococcal nuclease